MYSHLVPMTIIQLNLKALQNELEGSDGVQIVAVSKYYTAEHIAQAYELGQRAFGESYVHEMCKKHDMLPQDIEWHFIGHLQTNKVKYIAPFVKLIHSVDSMHLLKEIDRQACKLERTIDCLMEVHIAKESTKFGFTPQELVQALEERKWQDMKGVRIVGLMCMASFTDNEQQIRDEFHAVKQLMDTVKHSIFNDSPHFCQLSMGMSHDYKIAIEEGSTLVRIGTKIFGPRF